MRAPNLLRLISVGLPILYLRLNRHRADVRPLRASELDEAARLLSEQFCEREPLCRHLRMRLDELLPFFRDQVAWAMRRDLTIGVFGKDGTMLAVATFDDHCDQYQPDPSLLTDALASIGRLLDELSLPPRYLPSGPGEVCSCQLAASRPGHQNLPLFTLLSMGIASHTCKKGYRRSYAKVTNPLVLDRMQGIEKALRRKFYEILNVKSDADFPAQHFAPLEKFRVTLVTWPATRL